MCICIFVYTHTHSRNNKSFYRPFSLQIVPDKWLVPPNSGSLYRTWLQGFEKAFCLPFPMAVTQCMQTYQLLQFALPYIYFNN